MSKKTLTPSDKFVTIRDSKGLKFMDVVGAAYNKANLSEAEAQRVNQAKGLNDLLANHIAQHRHEVPPILKLVGTTIANGSKRFVAKDHFTRENGFYLWPDFRQYFLDKVEEDVGDKTIAIHRLEKDSLDAQIRKELGENREETKLAHFYDLLKRQSNGQEGHLLVNGYANIAYIFDKNDKLWAVYALWYSGVRYCLVNASSVENPRAWSSGRQVVSSDC